MSYSTDEGSKCFNFFYYHHSYAHYARGVVFLAVYLGILITLCVVRKRAGAGKPLIGLAYTGALSFLVIQFTYSLIINTLSACDVLWDLKTSSDTSIPSLVFSWIQTMLFLYVVFYQLNMMLRKQLGQNLSVLRTALWVDLFILGAVLFVDTVILCYYYYWSGHDYRRVMPSNIFMAPIYISLAFDALSVLSVIFSGILSILAVQSLKRKAQAQTSLLVWVAVVHFSLLFGSVWSLASNAASLTGTLYYNGVDYIVLSWIASSFHALAYGSIIAIARNPVWRETTVQQPEAQWPEGIY